MQHSAKRCRAVQSDAEHSSAKHCAAVQRIGTQREAMRPAATAAAGGHEPAGAALGLKYQRRRRAATG
eukprot:9469557-Pyramimonas_sp.AAC.1